MQISKELMHLTDRDAEDVLGCPDAIDGDYSLIALLRAIVIEHDPNWTVDLLTNITCRRLRVKNQSDIDYVMSEYNESVIIAECISTGFVDIKGMDGWKSFDDKPYLINAYLSQFTKCKVFANETSHRIVAVVERRANHIWLQAFEGTLVRIMSWYFPSDLSDEEKSFYTSFIPDTKKISPEQAVHNFIDYINKVAEKVDFRGMKLHKFLDGFADRIRKKQIIDQAKLRDSILSNIRSYTNDLAHYYQQLDETTTMLNGLENASPRQNNEMFEFFDQHKNVSILNVRDGNIQFGVEGLLSFYDEDEWKSMMNNKSSYIHEYTDETLAYMNAIFAEHRGVFRVNAVFDLQNGKLIVPQRNASFIDDSLPNPHIYFFACSGGNGQYYSRYADRGEWQLAIEQAIGATQNLSMGDSAVVRKMIYRVSSEYDDVPCIYVNGGNPIDKVTSDMKLVSFREFRKIIDADNAARAKAQADAEAAHPAMVAENAVPTAEGEEANG